MVACSQGTLHHVWGHLWSSPLGGSWHPVGGAGMLRHTPQRPGRPQGMTRPDISSAGGDLEQI